MAVIPLIPGETVVERQEDFASGGGVNGGPLLIRGGDLSGLGGLSGNVSYDLRVGRFFREHREQQAHELGDEETIDLMPGMAVVIQTAEQVHMPASAFGVIVPKVGLLHKGVSNTCSKIDPGFDGPLLVTAFNLGKKKVPLKLNDAFCSMFVIRVEQGVRMYNKPQSGILSGLRRKTWGHWRFVLEANIAAVTVLLMLVQIVTILLAVRK